MRSELRALHGLFTSILFAALTFIAIVLGTWDDRPSIGVAAGLLTIALLFQAVSILPRSFITEEEQGTFELLRQLDRHEGVYLGKAVYNCMLGLAMSLPMAVLFVAANGLAVPRPWLFYGGVAFETIALASAVTLCGALVVGAANLWLLASAIALPLLVPQVVLSIGCLSAGLGQGSAAAGVQLLIGIGGFGIVQLAGGALLARAVWRLE